MTMKKHASADHSHHFLSLLDMCESRGTLPIDTPNLWLVKPKEDG
jgi:hypothetical protein